MNLLTLPIRLQWRVAKGSLLLAARLADVALRQVPGFGARPGAAGERPAPGPAAAPVTPPIPASPAATAPTAAAAAAPAPSAAAATATADAPTPRATRTRRAPASRRQSPSPKERRRASRREPTRGQAAELRERAREADARAGDDDPGPGATLRVLPPWEGYDTTPVDEVLARLRGANAAVRAEARLYEETHERREAILRATDDGAQGSP